MTPDQLAETIQLAIANAPTTPTCRLCGTVLDGCGECARCDDGDQS